MDFPGAPVVKNLPPNGGDMGSILGLWRSHMPGATNPVYHNYWSPRALEPMLHSKRSDPMEKPTYHN